MIITETVRLPSSLRSMRNIASSIQALCAIPVDADLKHFVSHKSTRRCCEYDALTSQGHTKKTSASNERACVRYCANIHTNIIQLR